jgi:hypothetical protein
MGAFFILGIFALPIQTSKAATICYSTTITGGGMWNIWRCTPGPEGCVREKADVYLDDLWCTSVKK